MIIGLIIYIPFSQGFPFVILAALVLQAFSGARIGLIPLIYIIVFLSLDVIKSLLYFENVYTQIALGFFYYIAIIGISLTFTGAAGLEEKIPYLLIGAMLTGAISPAMVYIVSRLQKIYES
ncbi:MAG TPA: hypothetical protein ENN05_09495 [Deltaproteobacteria bacterium]|nr:hypothetical protein [Deltaproteobacteria bacterium]